MSEGEVVEQGTVSEVFLHPKSDTARRLIDPAAAPGQAGLLPPNTLRIAFTGDDSGAPVISDMTLQCGVMVNILSANTENIGGSAFGQMLIELPSDEDQRQRVCAYLDKRGIPYECNTGEGRMPLAPSQLLHSAEASIARDIPNNDIYAIGEEAR